MMSAGFKWGSNLLSEKTSLRADQQPSVPRFSPKLRTLSKVPGHHDASKKRKYLDDDMTDDKQESSSRRTAYPVSQSKRLKTPKIVGQSLPMNRLVEVLDDKSLRNLLSTLIDMHPEIANTVDKLSPRPPITSSMELLKEKFRDIINHMPYKCEVESDYSYLRIKPYFMEFLSCLSDFILNYLPPIVHNTLNSLAFLDAATTLLHELPNFESSEFQYTRSIAYERVANTWLVVVSGKIYCGELVDPTISHTSTTETTLQDDGVAAAENSYNLVNIVNSLDLLLTLEKHNRLSEGRFTQVIDFLKSEQEQVKALESSKAGGTPTTSVLGELITVDYSNFSISH